MSPFLLFVMRAHQSQSWAKLAFWLLAATTFLAVHTGYLRHETEPAHIPDIYGLIIYEEPGPIQPLYTKRPEVEDTKSRHDIIIPQSLQEKPSVAEEAQASSPARLEKKHTLFRSLIIKATARHQIDPALIKAIIMAESGYNPKAVSKKGAKGLMQLMPQTAKSLGVEDIFNPEHNINAGVGYLKRLLNQFDGDLKLALAAYNAGSRMVRRYRGIPPFKSTRRYIKKVFEYHNLYREQMSTPP